MNSSRKKIVCFGGGSALPKALFPDLKRDPFEITLINSMIDSGGSSGQLRRSLKVLPPGDIQRHILVLSDAPQWKKALWSLRFGREKFPGGHRGHSFANIFIAGLEYILKDYQKTLKIIYKFMEVNENRALPATIKKTHLCALLENGEIIIGEDEIDIAKNHNPNLKIKKVFLKPKVKAYLPTIRAVEKADAIIIGPGDLYSSILACFLPLGMKRAIQKSRAKKIYICNLMTKKGETEGFSVIDFTKEVEKYIGCFLDFVLYNTKIPTKERIKKFRQENPFLLEPPKIDKDLKRDKFIGKDLLLKEGPIFHDSKKVVKALLSLI